MGRFVKGDVVVIRFPFTDLTASKRRPALVVARAGHGHVLLCQITSQPVRDASAIPLEPSHFERGGLKVASNLRPNRLFTAQEQLVAYRVGRVAPPRAQLVVDHIKAMLDAPF